MTNEIVISMGMGHGPYTPPKRQHWYGLTFIYLNTTGFRYF